MSEEELQESGISEEITLAHGLAKAFESSDDGAGERGRRRGGPDPLAALRTWQPRTRLGLSLIHISEPTRPY